ncbi:SAP domain-containing ribonucleoprotein [Aricia agestis]|uniref:SAP domain-containing ribonucleoprotein n=1 Tax=Aricia agestis TaxID=91739 RepID=UPI001C20AF97|nr:SAP domain-containing ribonucleoprotein [Aricia agestis]
MADSTLNDVSKMKVVDLRKELKSRGLSYAGDKAELIARLQGAMAQDEHADINLDSDEIDSDGVLEDEDDKSQNDILDDSAVDTINEELALADASPPKPAAEPKPPRTLKRKIAIDNGKTDKKEEGSKKIVLNRTTSITTITAPKVTEEEDEKEPAAEPEPVNNTSNKIKITCEMDAKTRLEMRAKRFGLPVKMSDAERKEARKQRFNQNSVSAPNSTPESGATLTENIEKLRKRAERFGQNVSSIMTVIENKEKLEKRKEKFNIVK